MEKQLLEAPTNTAAEWSVIAAMLTQPGVIGEVIGIPIEERDFSLPDTRALYRTTVTRYYAGEAVDPLIVGELAREELAACWQAEPQSIGQLLVRRTRDAMIEGGTITEHAAIVKRLSTSRQLQDACYAALNAINDGKLTPAEVGDHLSGEALQITSGSVRRTELLDWMDVGTQYVKQLRRVMEAQEKGQEIGVYTGMPFFDDWTSGIAPGELCFLAGEPGIGKTSLGWAAGLGFAGRQMSRVLEPGEQRIGTMFASLEMNLHGSTQRIVSSLTGIDGVALREGKITRRQYAQVLREWKNRENLPIRFNFASNFRLSQLRALIAEGIRKANIGFVIIDHFRMLDTDRVYQNPNSEDEAKVRFLKEQVAEDLGVAVMCLAHTIKVGRGSGAPGESPKPRLSDLRGSGQIAAHADFVAFLWSPAKHMSEEARFEMQADPNDMELSWEKNRFGTSGTAKLRFEAKTMKVLPR
ncbi:MAG: AAA family ATPase [Actinomycetota bacterium]|nr:AAA family ATPase [Actinomycetota bacterium]